MRRPKARTRSRPYLYRFWRRLPGRGYVAIFDGSWYERVLAERVDGQCTPAEWSRAYRELDQFERQLIDFGAIVVKFWLHVGVDEQQRRAAGTDAPGVVSDPKRALRGSGRGDAAQDQYASARPGRSSRPTTRHGRRSGCWM